METGRNGLLVRPSIFPLAYDRIIKYASSKSVGFGWWEDSESKNLVFQIAQYKMLGSRHVTHCYPMTEAGWNLAWNEMATSYPGLASEIIRMVELRDFQLGITVADGALADIEADGLITNVGRCVLIGGYGYDASMTPGTAYDLYYTKLGVWVSNAGGWSARFKVGYPDISIIDISGPGLTKRGGGFVGGGFGLSAAAEGMIIASVLNSLTTRSTIQTLLRIESVSSEMFFFCSTVTPGNLRIQLSEVLSKIGVTHSGPPSREGADPDLTAQLVGLGEMFTRGLLTSEEFATAKARLLG